MGRFVATRIRSVARDFYSIKDLLTTSMRVRNGQLLQGTRL